MIQSINFSNKILFLEFFIRAYHFYGKGDVRTKLPPDSFFYTGASKAVGYKEKSVNQPLMAFDSGKSFISDTLSEENRNKLFKENTNIVGLITEEYLDDHNVWWKKQEKVISNKTGLLGNGGQLPYVNFKGIAPYGFSVLGIHDAGVVETNFPRPEVTLYINPGQTLCFLCRKDQRKDGEWYSPNINLVMFVKNHGLHDCITFRSQADINRMADQKLCDRKFDMRDFRKSRLNFELG